MASCLKQLNQAQIAQSVEQRTENPRVGSSILSLGTISLNKKGGSNPFFVYIQRSKVFFEVTHLKTKFR